MLKCSLLIVAGLACVSQAQSTLTWEAKIDYGPGQTSVNPNNPTVSITLLAHWDVPVLPSYCFGGADLSLMAGDGIFELDDWLTSYGTGSIFNGVKGYAGEPANPAPIQAGQLHWPENPFYIVGNPEQPFQFVRVTWETTDFAPRSVAVNTATIKGNYHKSQNFVGSAAFDAFVEASAEIIVVPSPPALLALGTAILLAKRRRFA